MLKTPQLINNFNKDSGPIHKEKKTNADKKKRIESFKRREISEPNLLPLKKKIEEKKYERFTQNSSMGYFEKKKEKKETSFKKNKEAFIS